MLQGGDHSKKVLVSFTMKLLCKPDDLFMITISECITLVGMQCKELEVVTKKAWIKMVLSLPKINSAATYHQVLANQWPFGGLAGHELLTQ